jgi:NAD(P)-dependent dehydrogenase (short-subunit alcohol dehydrogenase family)
MGARLYNKTALVTGATSNIGLAIASLFAAEGAHVIVSGRSRERGTEVVARIRDAGGTADFIAADLDGSARASRELAADATRVLGGRIDVLVNNAGIYPGPTTIATDEATFDEASQFPGRLQSRVDGFQKIAVVVGFLRRLTIEAEHDHGV